MSIKKTAIKKVLLTILWVTIGAGTVILSVAAMKRQSTLLCKDVKVDISGVNNNFFIDNKDVLRIIVDYIGREPEGTPVADFNLKQIEAAIERDVWVDNAELFFDRNNVLQVDVDEREPVARVFTKGSNTFYIDSATMMLPISEKFSARLPVFTGFPSEARVLQPADSALLRDIKRISIAIQNDSFLMAMIDQVDIMPDRTFEMTPKLGDQQIVFGDGSDIDGKFKKLKLFYKTVIGKYGWGRYGVIDLEYKDQVVAKLRGKEDVVQDSLRTLQLMNYMAVTAAIQAADSLKIAAPGNDNVLVDASLIQQSVERDDEGMDGEVEDVIKPLSVPMPKVIPAKVVKPGAKPAEKPVAVRPTAKPVAKPVVKPVEKKPVVVAKPAVKKPGDKKPVQKPKAVMPRNDY